MAIVSTKPPKTKGHLVNFLLKNTKEKRADIVANKSKDTQDCRLSYKVIGQNKFGYLLEVKPQTGRFHQIRAQLAHIGLPIIGDETYGSDKAYVPLSICLHAWKLTYEISGTKESQSFEAPLPDNAFWEFEAI